MTAPAPTLWRHRAFLRLWAAQAVSGFGARIAREGLPMTAALLLQAPPAAMGALAAVGLGAYALDVLKLSTALLGLTIAAGGVGALIGSALAPALTRRLGAGPAIVGSAAAMGLVIFLIPLASGAPPAAMALLAAAQFAGDALRTVKEIGQTSLPQSVMAPAAGAFATGQGAAGFAGVLIGGALGSWIGPRETLFLAAAGVTATPLIGLASPLWRARV